MTDDGARYASSVENEGSSFERVRIRRHQRNNLGYAFICEDGMCRTLSYIFPIMLWPMLAVAQTTPTTETLVNSQNKSHAPPGHYIDLTCAVTGPDLIPTRITINGQPFDPCSRSKHSLLKAASVTGGAIGGAYGFGKLLRTFDEPKVREAMEIFLVPPKAIEYSAPRVTRVLKSKLIKKVPPVALVVGALGGIDSPISAPTIHKTGETGTHTLASNVGKAVSFSDFGIKEELQTAPISNRLQRKNYCSRNRPLGALTGGNE